MSIVFSHKVQEKQKRFPSCYLLFFVAHKFLPSAVFATASAAAGLAIAAARTRRALREGAPHRKGGERDDENEDERRGNVHFPLPFRKIAHRQKRSTRIVPAVQKPKPPPATNTPIWYTDSASM